MPVPSSANPILNDKEFCLSMLLIVDVEVLNWLAGDCTADGRGRILG